MAEPGLEDKQAGLEPAALTTTPSHLQYHSAGGSAGHPSGSLLTRQTGPPVILLTFKEPFNTAKP